MWSNFLAEKRLWLVWLDRGGEKRTLVMLVDMVLGDLEVNVQLPGRDFDANAIWRYPSNRRKGPGLSRRCCACPRGGLTPYCLGPITHIPSAGVYPRRPRTCRAVAGSHPPLFPPAQRVQTNPSAALNRKA